MAKLSKKQKKLKKENEIYKNSINLLNIILPLDKDILSFQSTKNTTFLDTLKNFIKKWDSLYDYHKVYNSFYFQYILTHIDIENNDELTYDCMILFMKEILIANNIPEQIINELFEIYADGKFSKPINILKFICMIFYRNIKIIHNTLSINPTLSLIFFVEFTNLLQVALSYVLLHIGILKASVFKKVLDNNAKLNTSLTLQLMIAYALNTSLTTELTNEKTKNDSIKNMKTGRRDLLPQITQRTQTAQPAQLQTEQRLFPTGRQQLVGGSINHIDSINHELIIYNICRNLYSNYKNIQLILQSLYYSKLQDFILFNCIYPYRTLNWYKFINIDKFIKAFNDLYEYKYDSLKSLDSSDPNNKYMLIYSEIIKYIYFIYEYAIMNDMSKHGCLIYYCILAYNIIDLYLNLKVTPGLSTVPDPPLASEVKSEVKYEVKYEFDPKTRVKGA